MTTSSTGTNGVDNSTDESHVVPSSNSTSLNGPQGAGAGAGAGAGGVAGAAFVARSLGKQSGE